MNTVNVRKVEIGKGIPKICVPVVGITRDDIIDAACKAKETADLVEWQGIMTRTSTISRLIR